MNGSQAYDPLRDATRVVLRRIAAPAARI